ncbi:MAG: hypothetical protein QOH83_1388 [Solirubrobacteraceae bacterium]|jgi:hypothetical protein|nr:hypothetical protein [Solirubrobacteraceae bacterium]
MPAVAVTPAGVRDGEPAALIGLCSARGPSVLAYCRHVAGDADAAAAAADAFARFRAAVVATDDLADLNPEALLISATRSAAADHVGGEAPDGCAEVPSLLAGRADKTASSADLERLDRHLEGCWACRAPVARFKAAERAYRDPPDPTLDPEIAAQIFVALATAAPARGAEPPASAPPPSANGGARRAPAAGVLPVIGSHEDDDDATTEYQTLDALAPKRARGRFATRAPIGPRLPRTATATAAARPPLLEPGASVRPSLRLPVVLPIGLVLLALLVALFVSGVFGGSDPASSPSVAPPTAVPSDTPPADVVAVPGAKEASARAVEIAKARDRERERAKRERAAAPKRKAAASTPATPPPPPAATAAPPPAAATSPPPAPAKKAPKTNANTGGTEGGGSSKIDTGNGATGSEQIPPAQDSKNVPDLAPPPEPATSP